MCKIEEGRGTGLGDRAVNVSPGKEEWEGKCRVMVFTGVYPLVG